ncbi:hypothetical protein ES703_94335 [subsurface metagenome]
MSKKDDNPGEGFVPIPFCDERTERIEAKIEGMKNEILIAVNEKNSLSWPAKATIISSMVMAAASIIVVCIQVFG